jgi:hypothetical protein
MTGSGDSKPRRPLFLFFSVFLCALCASVFGLAREAHAEEALDGRPDLG